MLSLLFFLCSIQSLGCIFAKLFIWTDMGHGKWYSKAHISRLHSDQVRGEELKYNYLLVLAAIVNWINNNIVLSLQALLLATNILTCFLLVMISKLNVGILNKMR